MLEYNDKNLLELYNQKLSHVEIARELHVTRNVVSGRLSRIKKKNPELVAARIPCVHPTGKHPKHKKEVVVVKKIPLQKFNNRRTVVFNRNNQPSKSEMQNILRQAVENTK